MITPCSYTETAFAKINLALNVRGRRDDGYHDIESVFAFAEHGDVLVASLRDDGGIALAIDGPFAAGLDAGEGNLVLRAAYALKGHVRPNAGADIRLTKNLPVASGIGGGSADAAATLRLLAGLWECNIGMHDIAAALGSDVPACLVSRTLIGTGRGEAMHVGEVVGLSGLPLLLINPGAGLSTASVFAGWDRVDQGPLDASSLKALIDRGRNDLYAPAVALVPEIADVVARLSAQPGAIVARMSGSGATCFALFDTVADRDAAAAAMPRHWWTMASRIRSL
ncbi:MAG: 4-(cytidine 5'-diphospho)-2-C-methyl-D-erythritol kinase [Sphingobium sp.]